MQQMIVIRDGTKHYKPVSLVSLSLLPYPQDPSQYTPPLFNRECPAGISGNSTFSPFSPPRFHEELRRKLLNLRADAQARKEGRLPESCWRETYLKKSVRKKQAKVRTCELCRVQFNNYLQVPLFPSPHSARFLAPASTVPRFPQLPPFSGKHLLSSPNSRLEKRLPFRHETVAPRGTCPMHARVVSRARFRAVIALFFVTFHRDRRSRRLAS